MSRVDPRERPGESEQQEQTGRAVPRPDEALDYYTREFVKNTLPLDRREEMAEDARFLDRREEDFLLIYPDDTRVFVGRDDTASNSGLFGYRVAPEDSLPMIDTVDEALDLLKPNRVAERLKDDSRSNPVRQGEWWFLSNCGEPRSQVFKGEVASRPYGASPLQNHVPRDYAFGATEDEIIAELTDRYEPFGDSVDSLAGLVEDITDPRHASDLDSYLQEDAGFSIRDMRREVFQGVYVRGTVRHRSGEHEMLSLGEEWHLALTHPLSVRSADPNNIYDYRSLSLGSGVMD